MITETYQGVRATPLPVRDRFRLPATRDTLAAGELPERTGVIATLSRREVMLARRAARGQAAAERWSVMPRLVGVVACSCCTAVRACVWTPDGFECGGCAEVAFELPADPVRTA